MKTSDYVSGYAPREPEPQLLMEPHIAEPTDRAIRRYVDMLNDECFKGILGAERNKEALMEILRVLIPERTISDIRYDKKKRKRNPFVDGHDAIFDVECIDENGARFVVEMQRWEQDNFYDRVLFYSTFPIQEQIPAYKKKDRVPHDLQYVYPPVYVVSLMAFSLHPYEDRLLYRYDLRDTKTGEQMSDKLTFVFLEMDKVKKEPGRNADILTKLSWALMNIGVLRERPAALVERIFKLLFEACELDSYEPEKRTSFIEAMTTERDKANIAYTYWRKGKAEGHDEGVAEGIEQGIEQEKRRTANRLLEMGLPVKEVAKATGLSEKEIARLQ